MIRSAHAKRGTFISRAALGVALTFGVVAGGSFAPEAAFAQKKPKEQKLSFSKGFLAAAQPAQKAVTELQAGDAAAAAAAKTTVEQATAAAENADDRFMAGSLTYNLAGKTKDAALQRAGLKLMLESGKAEPTLVPQLNAAAGQLALNAQDHAAAQQYLQQAIDTGYPDAAVKVMLAESYMSSNQTAKGMQVFKAAISDSKASGKLAPDSWYRRGLVSAYKAGMLNESADFGAMLVSDYPDPKNVGVAVTIVRELGKYGAQDNLDLLRLMGRTNSFAEQRDYIEYIEAADARRHPGEVVKVIDAGIASGKLSASDTFVREAKTQASGRLAADKASLVTYEADARKASASESTVSGAADALLSYGEAAKAADLYQIALSKSGGDTNRTLTRLGIAQVDQGKYADAQATFAKVQGPRSAIAKLWSAYAEGKSKPAAPAAAPAG